MRIFILIFVSIVFSSLMAVASFYIFLFLTWGRILPISTGAVFSILFGLLIFIMILIKISKKNNIKKVIASTVISLLVIFVPFSIYIHIKNSTLYMDKNYPCQNKTIESKNKLVLITYRGTPLEGFPFTQNTLEIGPYYDMLKKNASHEYIKTYSKGSKWKVEGLYNYSKNNVSYYLMRSLEDNNLSWLYVDNLRYKECEIDSFYNNKEQKRISFPTYLSKSFEKVKN